MMRTHTFLLAGLCAIALCSTLGASTTAVGQQVGHGDEPRAQDPPDASATPDVATPDVGSGHDAGTVERLTQRELTLRGVPEVCPVPAGPLDAVTPPDDGRRAIAAGASLMILGGAMQVVGLGLGLDDRAYHDGDTPRASWVQGLSLGALLPYAIGGVLLTSGYRTRRGALLDHAALMPPAAVWDPAAAEADFERTLRLARRRRVMTVVAAVALPAGTVITSAGYGLVDRPCPILTDCGDVRGLRGSAVLGLGVATTIVGGLMVIRAGALRRGILETEQRYQPYRFTVSPATAAGAWGGQLTLRY